MQGLGGRAIRLAAMALVLALAACGGSPAGGGGAPAPTPPPTPIQQGGPGGYLAVTPSEVLFLSWTRDGANVTGRLTRVYDDGTGSPQAQTTTLSGTVDTTSVSINFADPVDGESLWTGTVSGSGLSLYKPSSDGTLATLDFRAAAAGDYNKAADELRSRLMAALASAFASAMPTPAGTAGGANPGADSSAWPGWCLANGYDPGTARGCPVGPVATPALGDCTVGLVSYNATLSLRGVPDPQNQCRALAKAVSAGGAQWDQHVWASYRPVAGSRTVCAVQGVADYTGTAYVDDTGGAYYGGLMCNSLYAMQRPWMGISYKNIDYAEAQRLGQPTDQGLVEVTEVAAGGPAQAAGIKVGDVIVSVGDTMLIPNTVEGLLATHSPGDTIDVEVLRGGNDIMLSVTLNGWPKG